MANPNPRTDHLAPYQFTPGNSGNTAGRPKGKVSLLTILKEKLDQPPPGFPQSTWAEILVEKTILDAFNGDGASRKLVWAYIQGTPAPAQSHTDESDVVTVIDDVAGGSYEPLT